MVRSSVCCFTVICFLFMCLFIKLFGCYFVGVSTLSRSFVSCQGETGNIASGVAGHESNKHAYQTGGRRNEGNERREEN